MDELLLPVSFRGEELEFPVKMYAFGYTYRIEVLVEGTTIIFDPDEEGQFRAIGDKAVDIALLKAIAAALEQLR
ncbi:hypothetical protein FO440_14605 [Mucilaginibacter corticis]|uniref:Uncharacterized protein n=1 Tax=Mucilaginibacter corticis TaxID=2597670 RepID=A0A556MM41_9SPHI|nr:hypothetical protein [Mucilaginibacter corticis]TSJ40963.1 hypothetical protein FO440_14605 [Mucilaginibacter corticis]